MEHLRVTTINYGGLGTDPRKMPWLIAYLVCAELDIIHPQELGPTFTPAWLRGPNQLFLHPVWSSIIKKIILDP